MLGTKVAKPISYRVATKIIAEEPDKKKTSTQKTRVGHIKNFAKVGHKKKQIFNLNSNGTNKTPSWGVFLVAHPVRMGPNA